MAPTIIFGRVLGRIGARLTIVTLLCLSAMALMALGMPYGSTGGSALLKIHPATYLASITAVVIILTTGAPGRHVALLAARSPGLVAFGAAIVLLGFQSVVIQKLPASAVIDTFLLPFLLFVILTSIGDKDRRWLILFVHGFFLVNSTLGFAEQLTSFRLTPTVLAGELVTYEWRSTALLGHPLTNASNTGLYIILLSGAAGRGLRDEVRLPLLCYHAAAMFTFGGRTAFVLLALVLLLRAGLSMATALAGRPFDFRRARMIAAALVTVAMLGTAAGTAGAFDRFFGRFVDDSGSAATRTSMLHVLDEIPTTGILLGPEQSSIALAQRRLGITIAIESFPLAFVAQYGLIVSLLFFVGLGCYFSEFFRLNGTAAVLPILYWFAVNAGANSIAAKSLDLATATSLILLLRPVSERVAGRTGHPVPPRLAVAGSGMVR